MKRSMSYKIAMVVAAIALGSAAVSSDALARGGGGHGGGGGHMGGGFGGGHMGSGFGGGHMGGGFGGGHFGGGGRHVAHSRGFGMPYYGGDYDDSCWPSEYYRPPQLRYNCY